MVTKRGGSANRARACTHNSLVQTIRAGGVVTSKAKLIKACQANRSESLVENRKLRIAGLPNRKAAKAAKRGRGALSTKKR